MKVSYKGASQALDIQLDPQDIEEALAIQDTINTPGWQYLMKYLFAARELMIEDGKKSVRSTSSRDVSSIRWAFLKGLDEAIEIPKRILDRAREYLKAQQDALEEAERERNGTADAGTSPD